MSNYKLNENYRIKGKVLGVNFEESVYTEEFSNLQDVLYDQAYFWSEGNMSCDCNKRQRAFPLRYEDENVNNPCGDKIHYQELFLITKNGTEYDLMQHPRWADE